MVVTVAKATSADYYTGGGGVVESAESYYLDAVTEGEPAGQWSGTGAELLGLTGEVTAEDMTSVYSDFVNPVTGEPIGSAPKQHRSVEDRLKTALAAEPDALPERVAQIRAEVERTARQSVIGWDATFSVAKSVTVAHTAAHRAELAAVRSGDLDAAERFGAIRTGIESAIAGANSAMLSYAESLTVVRTGRHGGHSETARWAPAPGLTVASFFQHTNRNIDPQLHVHNVILNRAFSADGKARALDGQDLLAQKRALGAVADRVLEEALTAQGFRVELRPDGMARELTIVPTAVTDLFSSRTQQLSARVAELVPVAQEKAGRELTDIELYRLKQQATLSTRTAKSAHVHETTEEMIERWWASAHEVGSDLDQVAAAIDRHLTTAQTANGTVGSPSVEWSPSAVIAEAVAAVGEQRSTWRPSDLMLEIARRLPSLGGLDPKSTLAVLEKLTDAAIAGPLVQQVAGRTVDDLAAIAEDDDASASGVAAALEADPFTRPSARLYATTDTLAAEDALRRAAIEQSGHSLGAHQVDDWLYDNAPTIGADQRAAVIGIASTSARLSVLVGPAGTGKSYAAGMFAAAWSDLTEGEGRVVGLAVSQIATKVLQDDGIADARNIAQWLATQDRLARGGTATADASWRIRTHDVVMVDEASMVATADLDRIHALVEAAGARMVLTGDPRQLGAVEAGGVMGLLDGHAETYTLTDVRRFANDWEAAASLALRDGDPDALATYDRHGRLLTHDSTQDAVQAAATAAVADRLDGRSVVVVTGSNADAAAIATKVRDQLIDLGLVEADGVLLGRDGCTAGVGDLIAARRNDYAIGVTNRAQYEITAVGADGSLTVVPAGNSPDTDPATRTPVLLPAAYVSEDVQLGYASTVHAAQGMTVDSAHLVTDGTLDAASLYVAMSRGQLRNTAHVGLTPTPLNDTRPTSSTDSGGEVRLEDHSTRASARAALEASLEREVTNRAATVEAELDTERLSTMSVLSGRYEAVVRAACRERLDRHLDHLTAAGVLDPETRARLAAEQGTEHLSRLLRAVEQAGQDPHQALTDAISTRSLLDADSVAQVLSHRITGGGPLPQPAVSPAADDESKGTGLPQDIAPELAQHLSHLDERMTAREQTLADKIAAQPDPWALESLGPVPADDAARAEWLARAGTIAGYREATGWDHPQQPIGTMPGLSSTEKRAAYAAAWDALGRPEAGLDESAMTEGQLRVRARAAQLEKDWAPAHADAALRAAETDAEAARQAAAIARAQAEHAARLGDDVAQAQLLAEAEAQAQTLALKDAAIKDLQERVEIRRSWAETSVVTLDQGARAQAELDRRGLSIGDEPDRTTAEEWLTADHAARQSDDAHRVITETDLQADATVDDAAPWSAPDDLHLLPETSAPADGWNDSPPDGAFIADSTSASDVDTRDQLAERDPASKTRPSEEKGWGRSAAHAVLPESISLGEIEAGAAGTALVVAKINDRMSQDAAHTSEADRDAGTYVAVESFEAGRRRRESAELSAAQAPAAQIDIGLEAPGA